MSVRHTSDHFRRTGSGFKCRRGEIEHRLTSKRTKGTGWTLVPEVPADVKVALTAERPVFRPGGQARCRRSGGRQTMMQDADTRTSRGEGSDARPTGRTESSHPYRDPFPRGERSELLFFIPPTAKGDVDERIAGGRPVKIEISILSPRRKGSIEGSAQRWPK